MNEQLGHVVKGSDYISIKFENGVPKVFDNQGTQILGIRKLQLTFEVDELVKADIQCYVKNIEYDELEVEVE